MLGLRPCLHLAAPDRRSLLRLYGQLEGFASEGGYEVYVHEPGTLSILACFLRPFGKLVIALPVPNECSVGARSRGLDFESPASASHKLMARVRFATGGSSKVLVVVYIVAPHQQGERKESTASRPPELELDLEKLPLAAKTTPEREVRTAPPTGAYPSATPPTDDPLLTQLNDIHLTSWTFGPAVSDRATFLLRPTDTINYATWRKMAERCNLLVFRRRLYCWLCYTGVVGCILLLFVGVAFCLFFASRRAL